MNTYNFFIILGIAVIGVMGIIFGTDLVTMSFGTVQDFDIYVDPLLDKQNLFVTSRVTVKNVGSKPLTNVLVNFGDGDHTKLGTLLPQEKVIVSPPPGNSMLYVQVITDQNVSVIKPYREPPKMVGMMGS